MAKFIGSDIKTKNWAEDLLLRKCKEYFGDDCVLYRNKVVSGKEFDLCVLLPGQGIIIFEVKGWYEETILRIENNDQIIIRVDNNGQQDEAKENPTKQVRGYVFALEAHIKKYLSSVPVIMSMICMPNIREEYFQKKRLDVIIDSATTLFKKDLETKKAFFNKIQSTLCYAKRKIKYYPKFTLESMLNVRRIFEVNPQPFDVIKDNSLLEMLTVEKKCYSRLYYFVNDDFWNNSFREQFKKEYFLGVKHIFFVRKKELLIEIAEFLVHSLMERGLFIEKGDLYLSMEAIDDKIDNHIVNGMSFSVFNCTIFVVKNCLVPKNMIIVDGCILNNDMECSLRTLGEQSDFNIEQYRIEHTPIGKNVLIRAGAGTGKTFTMISRIGFICHQIQYSSTDMSERIVMITFTNEAADNMKQRLQRYFNNYYLLTGNGEYLKFINKIPNMQISTIHSYAKSLIELLGIELGYGCNVDIVTSDYEQKQIIKKVLNEYLCLLKKQQGDTYFTDFPIPMYQIQEILYDFIMRLHNQSVDIGELHDANFGVVNNDGGIEVKMHKLIKAVIPKAGLEYNKRLQENSKLHLNNIMAVLEKCLQFEENRKRLKLLQTGKPQFMFIDEFQDTDDIQIRVLQKISALLEYKLFVVGDIKQCIYRFRGAKEKAFDQLKIEDNIETWYDSCLTQNYRTDAKLLEAYSNSFSTWGRNIVGEPLLIYDVEKDRLEGMSTYNLNRSFPEFYTRLSFQNEEEQMNKLFFEVSRYYNYIASHKNKGDKLSGDASKIAILVRENWQAEKIRCEGEKRGVRVLTNTGGNLYVEEPALDMMTLINALLNYDEADYLYALVSSNFFAEGISKAKLYKIRYPSRLRLLQSPRNSKDEFSQVQIIQEYIDGYLKKSETTWRDVVCSLRIKPVFQVLQEVYSILKPWKNYARGKDDIAGAQNYYKENVDALFEEFSRGSNTSSLSINALADVLCGNIRSRKNVECRKNDCLADDGDPVVECITVHKAKGMAYGAVILPYCFAEIQKLKTSKLHVSVQDKNGFLKIGYDLILESMQMYNDFFARQMEIDERMREEVRILYVAMTRAIHSFTWLEKETKGKGLAWQNLIWQGDDENVL